MYHYHIYYKSTNAVNLSPKLRNISFLKDRYKNSLKHSKIIKYDDIDEIVVFKGCKIYGFYDKDFNLDKSKPVFVHNIFYDLD